MYGAVFFVSHTAQAVLFRGRIYIRPAGKATALKTVRLGAHERFVGRRRDKHKIHASACNGGLHQFISARRGKQRGVIRISAVFLICKIPSSSLPRANSAILNAASVCPLAKNEGRASARPSQDVFKPSEAHPPKKKPVRPPKRSIFSYLLLLRAADAPLLILYDNCMDTLYLYLLSALISCAVTAGALPFLRKYLGARLLDVPCGLKKHAAAVPVVGGCAVMLGLCASLVFIV